jgi:hypothetical protein
MSKKTAETDAVNAVRQHARMRTIGVVYGSASGKVTPANSDARLTMLERHLGSRLKLVCRDLAGSFDSVFYMAATGVGTGVWANTRQDREFNDRLRRLDDGFDRLVGDAVKEHKDVTVPGDQPLIGGDLGQIWIGVFIDIRLESLIERCKQYLITTTQAARKPVPKRSTPPPRLPPHVDVRSGHLDALLATVPKDATYEEQARELEALRRDVNHRITDRVVSAIKETLQRREHDSYVNKLETARWLNAELRAFDLTISSPRVGGTAILSVNPGGRGGEGRFILKGKTKGEDGKYQNFYTQDLVELLSIIELGASHRREALTEWRGRVAQHEDEVARS